MSRMVQPPSGTVTLLFTDIEGSTRIWEAEPEPMARALRRHDEVLRSAIAATGGFVFKTVGDAFCAAFATPQTALDAAVAAQRHLAAESWPTAVCPQPGPRRGDRPAAAGDRGRRSRAKHAAR